MIPVSRLAVKITTIAFKPVGATSREWLLQPVAHFETPAGRSAIDGTFARNVRSGSYYVFVMSGCGRFVVTVHQQ